MRVSLSVLETETSNRKCQDQPLYPLQSAMNARGIGRYALLEFFVLTYVITWGLIALFLVYRFYFFAYFGPMNLSRSFYRIYWHLCVYAPAISAFAVIARRQGFAGVRDYVRRVLRWRIGIKWYLIVLVAFPAFYALDRTIFAALGGSAPAYPAHPWYLVFPAALLSLVSNPAPVEELGWRGYALPLLQRRFSAFQASMILGAVWFSWHLPAFFILGEPYTLASLPVYFLQALSLTIIMTALYNATNGSILLAFFFHWQIHDPFHVSAFPRDLLITTLMLAAAAVVLIVSLGPRNLGRKKYTEPLSSVAEQAGLCPRS